MRTISLLTVLPSHGLEDFPTHHQGAPAEGLLASLTALWHPAIVHHAQSLPTWCRCDQIPENCQDVVLVVPGVATAQLPTGLASRVERQCGLLIQDAVSREAIAGQVLSHFQLGSTESSDLARDFYALAFVFWQVQLMTRQLRYSGNLDQASFSHFVLAAADAWSRNDADICRGQLQSAFDLLLQERNRYFPVDALLIDLLLIAPTTLGSALSHALQSSMPLNVLLTGDLAARIDRQNPQAAATIRERIANASLEIVGGCHSEARFPLLAIESLVDQFCRGRMEVRDIFATQPTCYARRAAGMIPILPQILSEWGFSGAIHAPFDQGRFPLAAGGAIEWQAPDGTIVHALSLNPVDAGRADGFARLSVSLGESFDSSHSAACLFAHWPGQTSEPFEDLRRSSRYGNVLGRFVTMAEFFTKSSYSGRRERYTADQYRNEFLEEFVTQKVRDPISRVVAYWRNQVALSQASFLSAMVDWMNDASGRKATVNPEPSSPLPLSRQNEAILEDFDPTTAEWEAASSAIQQLHETCRAQLRSVWSGADVGGQTAGLVAFNPSGTARRIICPVSGRLQGITDEAPVYAAEISAAGGYVAIDVPPFGFAVARPAASRGRRLRAQPPIVDKLQLTNEFFSVDIDPETGGIRSIHQPKRRGNLLSQMIGIRMPPGRRDSGGQSASYATPTIRTIQTTVQTAIVGEIVTTGELRVAADVIADFEQKVRVCRGVRVIDLEIQLLPREPWIADPWRHYGCCRFAWQQESAEIFRGVAGNRCPVVESRFEAPHFIDIVDGENRMSILTGGLPFHRRYDYRKLDCLLQTAGETETRFRLGIGVDVRNSAQAAIDFIAEPVFWEYSGKPRTDQAAAWLLRTDCRNLVVTAIESTGSGAARIRLQETEGRAGKCRLEAARPVLTATRVRLDGSSRSELNIIEGAAEIGFAGHEYFQIVLQW